MTTPPADRITVGRDQLAALLAHHADTIAARWRTADGPGAWVAASTLDSHAAELTADTETPAVRELLDSIMSFNAEQQPAAAPSAPTDEPSVRDTMGPADGRQKMRLLDRLHASTTPVEEPADTDLLDRAAQALADYDLAYFCEQRRYEAAAAVLALLPAPVDRAVVLQVWPLARVLADVRCGSRDWTWDEEWKDLDRRHAETGYLAKLEQEIQENGITTPVLIGSDGRLWDGHHRLRIAVRRGIGYVPVEISPRSTADEERADRPLSPYYEHPACGFHWHGRDGMDIPMRDGQPMCPRCELRRMADEAQQAETGPHVPTAHYRRDDGVDCCVHTTPVAPNSCEACRELDADEVRQAEADRG